MSHQHQSSVDSLMSVLTFTSEQYSELFDGPLSLTELVCNPQLLIGEHHTALLAASDNYRIHELLGVMEHAMDADGKHCGYVTHRIQAWRRRYDPCREGMDAPPLLPQSV